jgi:hypothetical protein
MRPLLDSVKHHPSLAKCITGVAFLSTPFIATRLRPGCTSLLNSLLFSFSIACMSIFFFSTVIMMARIPSIPVSAFPLIFLLAIPCGFLLAYFIFHRSRATLLLYLEGYLPQHLSNVATVNIPAGNYIYLRAMGDEAAGILSVAHFCSWLISAIAAFSTVPVVTISRLWSAVTRRGKIIPAFLIIYFAWWATWRGSFFVPYSSFCDDMISRTGKKCGVIEYIYTLLAPLGGLWFGLRDVDSIQTAALAFFMDAVQIVCPVVVLLVISVSAIFAVVVCLLTLLLAMFGWLGPGLALFGDFAVEPTPEGPVTLMHVDRKAQTSEPILALNHSRTYANPDALCYITKWVAEQLTLRSPNDETEDTSRPTKALPLATRSKSDTAHSKKGAPV